MKSCKRVNLPVLLRSLMLAGLVLAISAAFPARASAVVIHGVSIFKQCVSPKNSCATNADCDDNICGADTCATESNPGSNVVDCTIFLFNPANHPDNITVAEAADQVLNGNGSPSSSSNILVIGTSGTVSGPGCDAGSDLGGAETCTLTPGASISFRANYYTIAPTDPTPLNDRASITVIDTCSASPSGCSTTPNIFVFQLAHHAPPVNSLLLPVDAARLFALLSGLSKARSSAPGLIRSEPLS